MADYPIYTLSENFLTNERDKKKKTIITLPTYTAIPTNLIPSTTVFLQISFVFFETEEQSSSSRRSLNQDYLCVLGKWGLIWRIILGIIIAGLILKGSGSENWRWVIVRKKKISRKFSI